MLDRLGNDDFDLLVIGGGITGVGIALDAASRGLRTALVERDDFASGTSSRSSKMIHGGLRYLQQGDLRLVYQALRERQRLMKNAPHLVSILPFVIPVLTKDGPISKRVARALRSALWMYDLTGGLRIGKRHRRLDAETTLTHCPTLPADKLSSGFLYYDAAADDARLTLAIAKTAANHGAVVVNRCRVVSLTKGPSGTTSGAMVEADGVLIEVRATAVVSAAGVWADEIRMIDEGVDPDMLRPAKGVHITIPWRLVRNDVAVIISTPGDKRSIFIVPWGQRDDGDFEHCYVGTTDTDFDGSIDHPQIDGDDVDYLLRGLNHSLSSTITRTDITGVWAGLRPLVKDGASSKTSDLSRRHSITISDSGLITIAGGKLTTYREMSADAVDAVVGQLGRRGRSKTKKLRLAGAMGFQLPQVGDPSRRLARRYGADAAEINSLIADDPSLGETLVPGLRYVRAEALYAVRSEMATTLEDVLARRTRAHLQNRSMCADAAEDVADLIADELGWSRTDKASQVAAYRSLCLTEEAA
jgi:glycerol-3-phosphate dehydrogenase